jgi:hypothetical protein
VCQPADIVSGNAKLNLGMVAQIFNANPGLAPPSAEDAAALGDNFAALVVDDGGSDTREEVRCPRPKRRRRARAFSGGTTTMQPAVVIAAAASSPFPDSSFARCAFFLLGCAALVSDVDQLAES